MLFLSARRLEKGTSVTVVTDVPAIFSVGRLVTSGLPQPGYAVARDSRMAVAAVRITSSTMSGWESIGT
jgi:hypothetical protein